MAGHSKWANIQHRKNRQDEKRGKIWTRVIREIVVSARQGGGDISTNPRLRLALDKARAVNLPSDTIKRNIDKAVGNLDGVEYEEIRYEGYGVGGVAIIVDTVTDNRVRTVAEIRHVFARYGGNLGFSGSVSYQFCRSGQIMLAPGLDEDRVMEIALQAGAEDVVVEIDGAIELITTPEQLHPVQEALKVLGIESEEVQIIMRPNNTINLEASDVDRMQKLLDALEDLDDVQNVYHNATWD